ncbi:MAG: hypothetical protein V4558_13765 [Gemmatimonadota bacterium]
MSRAARTLFLVAFLAPLGVSALLAQFDRPVRGNWYCDTQADPQTTYATAFFDWTGLAAEAQNAFQQHLLAKYGYKGRVGCSVARPDGRPLPELQADMQRQYAQFRAQGRKVVETGFTMAAPGITLAYGCFAIATVRRPGMPDSSYFFSSKVFRLKPGDHGGELSNAWIAQIKSLHPGWFFPSPGCLLLPADPAAHAAIYDGQAQMYANLKPKVTQLDWDFAPGAAAQAPTPLPPPAATAAAPAASGTYPTKDFMGRPFPAQTFFCQYLGLAKDASGKYPLYQNAMFTMATGQSPVQNGWKNYIEATYHPSSPGNPMCAIIPDDPMQREGALKSLNLLTQPATQVVVKTSWKP